MNAVQAKNILKIAPSYKENDDYPMLVYYSQDPDSLFSATRCKVPADFKILLHDEFADRAELLPLSKVKDFVISTEAE